MQNQLETLGKEIGERIRALKDAAEKNRQPLRPNGRFIETDSRALQIDNSEAEGPPLLEDDDTSQRPNRFIEDAPEGLQIDNSEAEGEALDFEDRSERSPVINVAAPNVTVEAPSVVVNVPEFPKPIAPVVNIAPATINVAPPVVNLEATLPELTIPPAEISVNVDVSGIERQVAALVSLSEALLGAAAEERRSAAFASAELSRAILSALEGLADAAIENRRAIESLEAATLAPRKSSITRDSAGNITAAESRIVLN